MMARRVLTVIAALLIGIVVITNAAVELLAQHAPEEAARVWAGHPDVEISSAMTRIALAARSGQDAPPAAFALLQKAAAKDPMAPEPFLVRGVRLSLSGDAPPRKLVRASVRLLFADLPFGTDTSAWKVLPRDPREDAVLLAPSAPAGGRLALVPARSGADLVLPLTPRTAVGREQV